MIGDLATIRAAVEARLGAIDAAKLRPSASSLDESILGAVEVYSMHRPRRVTFEIAGDGSTRRFVLADALSGWKNQSDGVARLEVVSDAGTSSEFAEEVAADAFVVEVDTAGRDVLRLLDAAVPVGSVLRISAVTSHRIGATDANETTILAKDREAFLLLAVAKVADLVARSASDLADSHLGGAEVDYSSVADRWAERAKDARREALSTLSPKRSESSTGGGAFVEWTEESFLARQRRVSH